ncbi:choice-of-anchor I family protein [Dyadobacter chenwenxiniae]|uniref:Choice-of-anchor I family protein n=1 Tax=Dyadobacter chenwenxiniae TaxID=2906456 RepID=A0A9X1PLW4_9BACT|nr:choice-of-anchor I family protein [Dyadobacter chenwenxiniae]MCF0062644.1 choice-of-anchor I family protein [Dyadobacter chenwenxiniae]UON83612.1 choice-of-anchor I family protein [Dyadobacter chenwenxiniae]
MKNKNLLALTLLAAAFNSCTDHFPENPETPVVFKEVASIDLGETAASEISAYDPATARLFTVNNESAAKVDVLDLSAFPAITKLQSIDISKLGGVANSVAVSQGKLAIALEASNKQANGNLIVMNTATLTTIKQIAVGALPDMVTFSPDGKYIVTANEGEPNADYTADPEGSVSIIDVTDNYNVKTLTFGAFAGSYNQLALGGFRVYGPGASFAQDIEPEYVAISSDSKKAFVTLQENNGIAELDLTTGTILKLHPLGSKDISKMANAMDASDKDNKIALAAWPVKSFYLPDAIAPFSSNGSDYLITANEGDAREYAAFDEQKRVSTLSLDATVFPDAVTLKKPENLGRLRVTSTRGDIDNDGDFDVLYGFGGRGFSIFNASTGQLVFDSASSLEEEVIKAGIYDDDRSDDKGVEPEGVTIGMIGNKPVGFIALERVDAVAIYDLSNPSAPKFLQILKTGDAPEGVLYVAPDKSPNGKGLLVTSNEGDGTVKFYQI